MNQLESPYSHIADLYDVFVQTDVDIPFFVNQARQTPGEILELMAGTGRVTLPLVQAGAQVTCVDMTPEMVAILTKKLEQRRFVADVHLMDVRELSLNKQFDLIIIPFHSFPEITAPTDQALALAKIRTHLSDKGRLICTLHNPPVRLRQVDGQLHLIANRALPDTQGRLLVWIVQAYDAENKLVTATEFFEEYDGEGTLTSKRFTELSFHLLEKVAFENLVHQAGFEVIELYGDYSQSPFREQESPFMIWVLGPKPTQS